MSDTAAFVERLAGIAAQRRTLSENEVLLLAEVAELGRAIDVARADIASLRVGEISACHIPAATDELCAIVTHTAAATDAILESCEGLDGLAAELEGEAAERLTAATTRIYEACSFQDITGQRITKVVATLQTIERRVAQILSVAGNAPADDWPPRADPGRALCEGPQLPEAAMAQSDIDRLLASFD